MSDPTTIPGWKWMLGMRVRPKLADGQTEDVAGLVVELVSDALPCVWWPDLRGTRTHHPTTHLLLDPTDPATAGCLLALLGSEVHVCYVSDAEHPWDIYHTDHDTNRVTRSRAVTLGDACIAIAEALGRWPGGQDCA